MCTFIKMPLRFKFGKLETSFNIIKLHLLRLFSDSSVKRLDVEMLLLSLSVVFCSD